MSAPASSMAELLGSLSLATDAAAGFAPETALRTSIIAVRIGQALGLSQTEQHDTYCAGLLRYLGCTGYAPEQARINGGDDIGFLQIYADADLGNRTEMLKRTVASLSANTGLLRRTGAVAKFLADPAGAVRISVAHCTTAAMLAGQIGMKPGVLSALLQMYERWDGSGAPNGLHGEALPVVARVLHVAQVIQIFHHVSGIAGAVGETTRRSGSHLDPAIVKTAGDNMADIVKGLAGPGAFELYCDSEPRPRAELRPADIPKLALAFANFADLKSAFMPGHSPLVSELCLSASHGVGLTTEEKNMIGLAGLLHDLGRVAVPTGIWDKPSALSPHEWNRVKSHPATLVSILGKSPALLPIADVASAAHERLDGSGYPRRVTGSSLAKPARLLAAADVFAALTHDRPHRLAYSRTQAAKIMGAEVSAGRLDRKSVNAVLDCVEVRRPPTNVDLPAGLTLRELEVLCLLAQGLSNNGIAGRIGISSRTVQTHVMHIFEKTGLKGRAAAALFAVQHGLANYPHSGG